MGLLELLAVRVIDVSLLTLGDIESVAVVRVELNALLYPENKVGGADEVSSEYRYNVTVLVLLDQLLRVLSLESTSDE